MPLTFMTLYDVVTKNIKMTLKRVFLVVEKYIFGKRLMKLPC